MILTREIKVLITQMNYDYYYNYGYIDITLGEEIVIPVDLLSTGSNRKIVCKCDTCGKEKEVIFKNYIKYGNNWGEYFCRKCAEAKRKDSLMNNYGVEYPYESYIIRDTYQKTMKTRYGVDNGKKIRKKDE